jgi:hypothetical protein
MVEARPAHRFLMGLLERNQADYDHLLPRIRRSLARSTAKSLSA